MVTCEVGGCRVRAQKLARRRRRSFACRPTSGTSAYKTASSAAAAEFTPELNRADPLIDATKFFGSLVRENGRFGSMPLNDDYSDEGSAD